MVSPWCAFGAAGYDGPMETTGRRPTDEGLVARARIGDDEAFAELVRRHREVAFRVAYLVVGSAADAEEEKGYNEPE